MGGRARADRTSTLRSPCLPRPCETPLQGQLRPPGLGRSPPASTPLRPGSSTSGHPPLPPPTAINHHKKKTTTAQNEGEDEAECFMQHVTSREISSKHSPRHWARAAVYRGTYRPMLSETPRFFGTSMLYLTLRLNLGKNVVS